MTIFFTFWRISENLHRALPTVKFFQDISGSGQFFSIHFVNLFTIWFKKGACLKDASDSDLLILIKPYLFFRCVEILFLVQTEKQNVMFLLYGKTRLKSVVVSQTILLLTRKNDQAKHWNQPSLPRSYTIIWDITVPTGRVFHRALTKTHLVTISEWIKTWTHNEFFLEIQGNSTHILKIKDFWC